MPKTVKEAVKALFEPVTVFVLLPFYFVVTGLKVTLDLGTDDMLFFFVISTLAAMLGKIRGTTVPARLAGYRWHDAIRLAAPMQCKGFVELIILNVLLDAGLISSAAFSALILLGLVTTAMTMRLVQALEVFGAAKGAPISVPARSPNDGQNARRTLRVLRRATNECQREYARQCRHRNCQAAAAACDGQIHRQIDLDVRKI